MLLPIFENIHANLPIEVQTPVIRLPEPNAPPINRTSIRSMISPKVSRNFMMDLNLQCTTLSVELGRVEKTVFLNKNRTLYQTCLGRFVVDKNNKIVRGKFEKRSLHGMYVACVALFQE